VSQGGARITYLGHATTVIELDGCRLLTDPVLRDRVAHLRRVVPLDRALAGGVDAALVSHGHWDHLDLPSLRGLGRSLRLVVPSGLGRALRREFDDVVELEVGERVRIGALEVEATPAEHEGSRGPFGPRVATIGFAVLGSRRVLFFGDTDLFPELDGLVERLDVALVPIWGWGPSLGRGAHLDPERAAEAVRRLRPRVAIPVHWGTFRPLQARRRDFLTEPAAAFAAAAARVAPEVEVRVLRPGETTHVP
jgi:L-ascorbate metabolism protein UlaG (beta-lactamase superfamily)